MKHEEIISTISCGSLVIGDDRTVDPSEYIHRSDHHFCSVRGNISMNRLVGTWVSSHDHL